MPYLLVLLLCLLAIVCLIRTFHRRRKQQPARATEPFEDPLCQWLTSEEYADRTLTDAEKHQRALDRYWGQQKWHYQKSNEELGRDYERYVGYLYERDGFRVEYTGIQEGVHDSGRDLIIHRDALVYVVQCKYWGHEKTIHVNLVDQLYGSVERYQKEHPKKVVQGVFYTSATFSDEARQAAQQLGITVKEHFPLSPYPSIKCSISENRSTKRVSRIYHLPFHHSYDRVRIDVKAGEGYVQTIQEAIDKGFRGAYR